MSTPEEHKREARKKEELGRIKISFGIITVSSSRYSRKIMGEKVDDPSGDIAEKLIRASGFEVLYRGLIPDDPEQIRSTLLKTLEIGCSIVIFIGGTGLSRDDITVDELEKFFEKKIDGFGEAFRMLSYNEIGSSAILSRATAGVLKGAVIFALPGSPNAVKLALEKLILPEIRHILYIINRT